MKWNDFQCKVFSIFRIYSVVAIIAIESYVLSSECIKCLRLQFGRTSTECLNGIWMEWWWSPVGIVRHRWELCRGMRNHFSDREIKKNINNANKYEEEDLAHNQKWETSNCVHITKCDRRYFFPIVLLSLCPPTSQHILPLHCISFAATLSFLLLVILFMIYSAWPNPVWKNVL